MRGSPQAKVEVGIDVCSGGGDGFEQEVTVVVTDVETVPPHIFLADKSLRKLGAELMGEMVRGPVVRVYVGVGRCEKRRGLKKDDLVSGDECCEVVDDVCL